MSRATLLIIYIASCMCVVPLPYLLFPRLMPSTYYRTPTPHTAGYTFNELLKHYFFVANRKFSCWNLAPSWKQSKSIPHRRLKPQLRLSHRGSNDISFSHPRKPLGIKLFDCNNNTCEKHKNLRCDVCVWTVFLYGQKEHKNYKFLFYIQTCKWASACRPKRV